MLIKCTNFRSYHERWIITCIKYSYIRYIRDSRFTSNLARLKCGISWGQLFSEKNVRLHRYFSWIETRITTESDFTYSGVDNKCRKTLCGVGMSTYIIKHRRVGLHADCMEVSLWVVLLARAIYSYKFTIVKWRFITCSYYLFVKGTFSKKMSARKIFLSWTICLIFNF